MVPRINAFLKLLHRICTRRGMLFFKFYTVLRRDVKINNLHQLFCWNTSSKGVKSSSFIQTVLWSLYLRRCIFLNTIKKLHLYCSSSSFSLNNNPSVRNAITNFFLVPIIVQFLPILFNTLRIFCAYLAGRSYSSPRPHFERFQ